MEGSQNDWHPSTFPDYSELPELHYRDVWNTPRLNDDKTERKPDDYTPRANIRHLFEQGDLHLDVAEELKDFSERYAMSCELVETYLKHLQDLKLAKSIRDRERKEKARSRKNKMVHDYNWSFLMENGKLGTLTVMELEKYIKHHSLPNKGNKPDKIRCIALHLSSGRESYVAPEVNQKEEGEESEERRGIGRDIN